MMPFCEDLAEEVENAARWEAAQKRGEGGGMKTPEQVAAEKWQSMLGLNCEKNLADAIRADRLALLEEIEQGVTSTWRAYKDVIKDIRAELEAGR